jgi:hypothetical protein
MYKLYIVYTQCHPDYYYPCTQALRHIQTDYEKRLKDVETQKEQLLDEMEARETALINKVIKVKAESAIYSYTQYRSFALSLCVRFYERLIAHLRIV